MTNFGRGGGGTPSYASNDKQMAAYDSLPRSVREAIANGYQNWATYPIARRWNQGRYKDAAALVATIDRWNREAAEEDRAKLATYLDRAQAIGTKRDGRGRFLRRSQKT